MNFRSNSPLALALASAVSQLFQTDDERHVNGKMTICLENHDHIFIGRKRHEFAMIHTDMPAVRQNDLERPERRRVIKLFDLFKRHPASSIVGAHCDAMRAAGNSYSCVAFVGVAFGKNFGVSRRLPKRSCTSKNAM